VSARRLRLRLPAGPLGWLHPELGGAEPPPADGVPLLDLARTPLTGDALLAELASRDARELLVPKGPLGQTLLAWLVDRRGATFSVLPDGDALELRLAAAARAPAVETLLVADGTLAPRPLDRRSAREALARGDAAWVLPLRPRGRGPRDPGTQEAALLARLAGDPELAALAAEAGLLPVCLTDLRAAPPPSRALTRLAPSWWGLLSGDGDDDADEWLEALTACLCPDRRLRLATLRHFALAGTDLYAEALAGRFVPGSPPLVGPSSRPVRARVLALEGIDGAGKSAHAAALADWLRSRGLDVRTRRIFRRGVFHDTVTELTRRCVRGRCLHLWRLQRLVKAADSLKVLAGPLRDDLRDADVVLFDRYVPTHAADGPARLHHDPFTRELLSAFPRADLAFLLDLPEDEALARIGGRGARTVDENPWMLWRWRTRLLAWARAEGRSVLDARAPFEDNQRALRDEVEAALDGAPRPARAATTGIDEVAARAPADPSVRPPPAPAEPAPHEVPPASALLVDPAARPAAPLLLEAGGEFQAVVPWLAELLASGRIPAEVAIHLYACEILERLHERARAGDHGPWSVPLAPQALARAASLRAHALREIEDTFPWPVRVEAMPAAAADVACVAREWLGWSAMDPGSYLEALAVPTRGRVAPPQGASPAHVVADGLLLRDGRLLLERRPEDARAAPGAWDSPGGHVEPGESPMDALRRELLEELGLRDVRADVLAVLDEVEAATGEVFRHHVFVVGAWAGEPRAREGQSLAWWPLADARALRDLQPVTAEALAALQRWGAAR